MRINANQGNQRDFCVDAALTGASQSQFVGIDAMQSGTIGDKGLNARSA